jgi:hypothetical protein
VKESDFQQWKFSAGLTLNFIDLIFASKAIVLKIGDAQKLRQNRVGFLSAKTWHCICKRGCGFGEITPGKMACRDFSFVPGGTACVRCLAVEVVFDQTKLCSFKRRSGEASSLFDAPCGVSCGIFGRFTGKKLWQHIVYHLGSRVFQTRHSVRLRKVS